MTIHPREGPVTRAGIDLSQAVSDVSRKYDLTFAEIVRVMVLALEDAAKLEIREERGKR